MSYFTHYCSFSSKHRVPYTHSHRAASIIVDISHLFMFTTLYQTVCKLNVCSVDVFC